jgi:hypothetical protein
MCFIKLARLSHYNFISLNIHIAMAQEVLKTFAKIVRPSEAHGSSSELDGLLDLHSKGKVHFKIS